MALQETLKHNTRKSQRNSMKTLRNPSRIGVAYRAACSFLRSVRARAQLHTRSRPGFFYPSERNAFLAEVEEQRNRAVDQWE